LLRVIIALFVTGGVVPNNAPTSVRGVDLVEKGGKAVRVASTTLRASEAESRCVVSARSRRLDVPLALTPRRAAPEPQTWMRPRRTPPPDDDGPVA
jgi:hypothetical protein